MKNYTRKQQISLSKFTENIFIKILDLSEDTSRDLTPIVKKYKEILKDNKIKDTEEYLRLKR